MNTLEQYIDHTALKPDTTELDIQKLCLEAQDYNFKSVCVNPVWVTYASDLLSSSEVAVCTVIGFPLGASATEVKEFETQVAVKQGATEIDMVINIGKLKSEDCSHVLQDIKAVVDAAGDKAIVKVIIETCLLNKYEKIRACELAKQAGADFVKTSTGFSTGGALVEDIALMRATVGSKMGVKASGGVRDHADAQQMIDAGATRIGTSNGIALVEHKPVSDNTY